jgi:hypothetical protein
MNVTTTVTTSTPLASTAIRRLERERDALATRLRIVEATLAAIERETELALAEPGVAFLVTRRVASIARQSRR